MSAFDPGRRAALALIGRGGVCVVFGGVLAGSGSRSRDAGAPGVEDDFRGIRIAAPGESSFTQIDVAGSCRLALSPPSVPTGWNDALRIVATDATRKEVFVTRATVERGRFAANLAGTLPRREARYDVYAVLGPHRSNVVRVSVSR